MNENDSKSPETGGLKFGRAISRRELFKGAALGAGAAAAPLVAACEKKPSVKPKKMDRKVIILGLDAMDPKLLSRFWEAGELPNLKKLAASGDFTELQSSIPPESPVAWSTFSVSAQAGVHGIYDFLNRDIQTYTPRIAAVRPKYPKFLWDLIPTSRPEAISLQTGLPFWKHAGLHGIKSAVLEAPVAFPAYEVEAESIILSGLTTPDLRGTQGTYQYFTTDVYSEDVEDTEFGGKVSALSFDNDGHAEVKVIGAWNPITRQKRNRLLGERGRLVEQGAPARDISRVDHELSLLEKDNYLTVPVSFDVDRAAGKIKVNLQGHILELKQGEWSKWVEIEFSLNFLIKLRGITKFLPTEVGEEVKIYMSPIEIHPEAPVFPISWPRKFSASLAEKIGPYKTRGWAADTAALKERKIGEEAFMEDLREIFEKRRDMAFQVLEHDKPNLFVEVFSEIDRVQHMYWRFIDKTHPLYNEEDDKKYGDSILEVYRWFDGLVGQVRERFVDDNALFIVLSDHGFSSFRKGVNINTWMVNNGFMKLKGQDDPQYSLQDLFGGGDFFVNVDWSQTKAYSLGLGLIFVNLKGRESQGIVAMGEEYDNLVAEIAAGLKELHDDEDDRAVVHNVYLGREVYKGERLDEAPDLVVGFNYGYRVSWQTALGGVPPKVLELNLEKWSGDHCSVDRDVVPGVLFANRTIDRQGPDLRDIAPTVLNYLDVPVPGQYEGRDLFQA